MEQSREAATDEPSEDKFAYDNHHCKICGEKFESLQEVLKHELLKHSASRKSRTLPANQLKRKVNAVLKTIQGDDEKKFREAVAEAISDCAAGTELDVIFKKYQMNNDDLVFIYSRVHTCLEDELKKIGRFTIEAYGSIVNGLALKTSDIDLHISCEQPITNPTTTYKYITRMLFRSKCFSDINPIRKARVPIIKCVHKATGFSLDINTSEPYGVHNSKFIHQLNDSDTRIHQLMLFLKIWSKSMHIYGTFNMTNYCLITLVIFYLQKSNPPVLGSIKLLQRNATKRLVNGVNFGVNERSIPFGSSLNIHELIHGFFEFYSSFDFEKYIIAPYLGKAINRIDFENKVFKYPEYDLQLGMFRIDGEVEELRTDRPVCIQDMFCLNVNVGKCLSETNIHYFKKCVTLAEQKCAEHWLSRKKLYKSLLVGIIEEIVEMFPAEDPEPCNNTGGVMSFDIIPRRNELKSLAKFADNPLDLQKLWTTEYINAIVKIVTEIYRIDMTLMSPTQNNKCKKIDETEEGAAPLPSKWLINSYVDLWSGRQMQRNNTTSFMDYQLAQTEKLHAERRQNSNFAVQFKGYLTISIIKNYGAIHVEASCSEPLCKKDPLRRFFGALKCSMQNYNLKQRIHQLEGQAKELTG